ncbi:MAG: hypothetical protein ACREA0_23055, partial [bacterium]
HSLAHLEKSVIKGLQLPGALTANDDRMYFVGLSPGNGSGITTALTLSQSYVQCAYINRGASYDNKAACPQMGIPRQDAK